MSGCAPVNSATQPAVWEDPASPTLAEMSVNCVVEEERWEVRVLASAWSGGGMLTVARSAERVEQHPIPSSIAAADGSWDCLGADLQIVADWRDAASGSSTGWRCADEEELSFHLTLDDASGGAVADCSVFGDDPTVFDAFEELEACEEPSETRVDAVEDCL